MLIFDGATAPASSSLVLKRSSGAHLFVGSLIFVETQCARLARLRRGSVPKLSNVSLLWQNVLSYNKHVTVMRLTMIVAFYRHVTMWSGFNANSMMKTCFHCGEILQSSKYLMACHERDVSFAFSAACPFARSRPPCSWAGRTPPWMVPWWHVKASPWWSTPR